MSNSPFVWSFLRLFRDNYGVDVDLDVDLVPEIRLHSALENPQLNELENKLLNALEDNLPDSCSGHSKYDEDFVKEITKRIFDKLFKNKTLQQAKIVLDDYATKHTL